MGSMFVRHQHCFEAFCVHDSVYSKAGRHHFHDVPRCLRRFFLIIEIFFTHASLMRRDFYEVTWHSFEGS